MVHLNSHAKNSNSTINSRMQLRDDQKKQDMKAKNETRKPTDRAILHLDEDLAGGLPSPPSLSCQLSPKSSDFGDRHQKVGSKRQKRERERESKEASDGEQ